MRPWKHGPPLPSRLLASVLVASALSGCGLVPKAGSDFTGPETPAVQPAAWVAPVPPIASTDAAGGGAARSTALLQWWRQFDDPLVPELVAAAQAASGSIAQAMSRIAQARTAVTTAAAAALPGLAADASLTRSAFTFAGPVILRTQAQAQLQSSWEIDLFGGIAREREAADARLDARRAEWHDARITVAAETALAYVDLRQCEAQLRIAATDAQSRAETARITGVAADAGLQAPATVALARASAAESADRLAQQRVRCDILVKGLVALTDRDEAGLRAKLSGNEATQPVPARFLVDTVPAGLLQQRPDLAALERELAAASADIGVAEAASYPRLSLAGSIGPIRVSSGGVTVSATTWSIGPTLTLPLVDHGRRAATLEAAKIAYASAEAQYRSRARNAVREVEEALVRLAATAERESHASTAATQYRVALTATARRHQAGLASLLELEDARRSTLQADTALVDLRRDRVAAWIALYRAVGGGWLDDGPAPQAGR